MPQPPSRSSTGVLLVCSGIIAAVIATVSIDGCAGEPAPAAAAVAAATPAPPPPPAPPAAEPATQGAAPLQPPPPLSAGSLVVHNPCQQPLLLAVNVQTAEGRRVSEGFFRVEPGMRASPAARGGPILLYHGTLHYYTETLDTEPVELGRRNETVGDRELPMKSLELDPAAPAALVLECPGMASGRP